MNEKEFQDRLQQLEAVSRRLEPGADERRHLLECVSGYAEFFLQGLDRAPAYSGPVPGAPSLADSPITESGIDIETALKLLRDNVDTPGINPASPRFFGYIPGGATYPSALGDYLAAVFNRYAGVFYASPGAVRMEQQLLRWMADITGYPDTMGGHLSAGGSSANLTGVVTAREAHDIRPCDIERTVIYSTAQVHHSVDKAIRIAGLSSAVRRTIATDDSYRMDADDLARHLSADKQAGLNPWLVVASAGTTNVGAVDPLDRIAELARQHGLWYHVDGAYGGFFVLCEEGKRILSGMGSSDSLIVDPHKTLFLPYGTGAVLVRDRQKLFHAMHASADYMQDALQASEEPNPSDLSPELTKHFRGLRLWLPLKLFGVAPYRAALAEKMELARYFHHRMQALPGWEVGPYPDLSIVTYRFLPPRGDADAFNRRLTEAVVADGRIFISSTQLDGRYVLRLAVSGFRTHRDTIELTLEILQQAAAALASS